jgi:hypothetical protein
LDSLEFVLDHVLVILPQKPGGKKYEENNNMLLKLLKTLWEK